ncbi:MAG: hypothetical protein GY830_00420 [Bacteroidetes bacterium]|nr:hypothetical protein [Bacteroidota bacterium]
MFKIINTAILFFILFISCSSHESKDMLSSLIKRGLQRSSYISSKNLKRTSQIDNFSSINNYHYISCLTNKIKNFDIQISTLKNIPNINGVMKEIITYNTSFIAFRNFFKWKKYGYFKSKKSLFGYLGIIFLTVNAMISNVKAYHEHEYVLGIDVETSGCSFAKNGLLSIGCSIKDENVQEVDNFQINIDLPEDREYEEDCLNHFWLRHPAAFEFIKSNTVSPEIAMNKFWEFIARAEKNYPRLIIVSDNPTFDIAWINLYLSLYTDRKPLNYAENNKYRQIWGASSIQKYFNLFPRYHLLKDWRRELLIPERKHREKLGLIVPAEHDHNSLTDARIIAENFIRTKKKMKEYLDEREKGVPVGKKPKRRAPIVIKDYDPKWTKLYDEESKKIKKILESELIEIHHIGSTSVPNLAAKPIIDIIAVVKDLSKIRNLLEQGGYKYKGEYNLPLRSLYKKKGNIQFFLHVHEVGSPEIELNLKFRNYLINTPQARENYKDIKVKAALKDDSNILTDMGITLYNLYKNDFIEKILKKLDLHGLNPRLCTQKKEWDIYKEIRQTLNDDIKIDNNHKHLVLYEGTEIIGASELEFLNSDYGRIIFLKFSDNKNKEMYFQDFFKFLEKWSNFKNLKFLTIRISKDSINAFEKLGFKVLSCMEDEIGMIKVL